MATLNTFEGGTDGSAITTGNSGGASGDAVDQVTGTVVYDDDVAPYRGAMNARCTIAGFGTSWVKFGTPDGVSSAPYYARIRVRVPALGDVTVFQIIDGSSNSCGQWRVLSTGQVQLRSGLAAAAGTSTFAASAGQWIDLGAAKLVHSTSVGQIEARIYAADGSVLETVTSAANLNTQRNGGTNACLAGITLSMSGPFTVDLDDLATDASGYPATPTAGGAPDPPPRPAVVSQTAVHRAASW